MTDSQFTRDLYDYAADKLGRPLTADEREQLAEFDRCADMRDVNATIARFAR